MHGRSMVAMGIFRWTNNMNKFPRVPRWNVIFSILLLCGITTFCEKNAYPLEATPSSNDELNAARTCDDQPEIDLRDQLPPVASQGLSPWCATFASKALLEEHIYL